MKDNKIQKPDIWYACEMFGKRFKMNQSMFVYTYLIISFIWMYLIYLFISDPKNIYLDFLFRPFNPLGWIVEVALLLGPIGLLAVIMGRIFPRYYPEA